MTDPNAGYLELGRFQLRGRWARRSTPAVMDRRLPSEQAEAPGVIAASMLWP